jgi:hypothetical protein
MSAEAFAYTKMLLRAVDRGAESPLALGCLRCKAVISFRESCFRLRGRHQTPQFLCYACGLSIGCLDPRPSSEQPVSIGSAGPCVSKVASAAINAAIVSPPVQRAHSKASKLPPSWRDTGLTVIGFTLINRQIRCLGRLLEHDGPIKDRKCFRCGRPAIRLFGVERGGGLSQVRRICSTFCFEREFRTRESATKLFARTPSTVPRISPPTAAKLVKSRRLSPSANPQPKFVRLIFPSSSVLPKRKGPKRTRTEPGRDVLGPTSAQTATGQPMLASPQRRGSVPRWTPVQAAKMRREMERIAAKENYEHRNGVSIHGRE